MMGELTSLAARSSSPHGGAGSTLVFGRCTGTLWRVLVVVDASVIPCPQGFGQMGAIPGVHCIRLVANQGHQAAIYYVG